MSAAPDWFSSFERRIDEALVHVTRDCREARESCLETEGCVKALSERVGAVSDTANRAERKADECNAKHTSRTEQELAHARAKLARTTQPDSDPPPKEHEEKSADSSPAVRVDLSRGDMRKLMMLFGGGTGLGVVLKTVAEWVTQ